MMVEHLQFEDPVVGWIAQAWRTSWSPLAACWIGRSQDRRRARHVPSCSFSGRGDKQMIVERHEGPEGCHIGVAEPRLAHRIKRQAVFRAEDARAGASRDR